MSEQSKVFLTKMQEKVKSGAYDKEITIPFMSRNSVYIAMKARVDKKLETGATPLLSEAEIVEAVKDAKEVAVITAEIFLKIGLIEKTDDGEWLISDVAKRAIPFLRNA